LLLQEDSPFVVPPLEMLTHTPSFYKKQLEDEPIFDEQKHLALPFKRPTQIWTLQEFGYEEDNISKCPSDLAVTSTFQLLTEEGVRDLRIVCSKLYKFHQTHVRTADFVRGGVYRSKFLKELSLNPKVTQFLSQLAGTPLAPHTLPLHLGHINYAPKTLNTTIDKWHTDTVEFVYVVLLTDPCTFNGGKFQFFKGNASQANELAQQNGNTLPENLVESPEFPKAGYAVFQQGSKVCHRASALTSIGERITVVNAYVSRDMRYSDGCRIIDLKGEYDKGYDPKEVLLTEWTRHKAWIAKSKLECLIKTIPFTSDNKFLTEQLDEAMKEIEIAKKRS